MITLHRLQDRTEDGKDDNQLSAPSIPRSSLLSSQPSTLPSPSLQRFSRQRKPNPKYAEIYEICNFIVLELENPENCEITAKEEVWVKAMKEEMKIIEKNKTWELVD